jgi:hypothetical protein
MPPLGVLQRALQQRWPRAVRKIWHVPPSSTVLRLSDVRALDATGEEVLPGQVSTEVQMSDVIGLMAEMASRPVKSPGSPVREPWRSTQKENWSRCPATALVAYT